MTPKEKAKELVHTYKYYAMIGYNDGGDFELNNAKQCALIAVDEILKHIETVHFRPKDLMEITENNYHYWQEVKQEILNL